MGCGRTGVKYKIRNKDVKFGSVMVIVEYVYSVTSFSFIFITSSFSCLFIVEPDALQHYNKDHVLKAQFSL